MPVVTRDTLPDSVPPIAPMTAAVTALVARWRRGDALALEQLTPLVYRELRRIAASRLSRECAGRAVDPAELADEAYLRLCGADEPRIDWENRAYFLAVASRLVRLVLIQHARAKEAEKRGSGAISLSLENAGAGCDLLGLDRTLTRLAAFDERKASVVELRYFGGLTTPEIAAELDVSTITVECETSMALAWLHRQMGQ